MSRNTERIPFARPSIGEAERQAALRVLDSGWLTTGPEAAALEEELAELVGAPYAKAVNSATAGLHLALEAMGVAAGDRVAMSPYTFTSTAEGVRYLGADPLFCDIEEESCNLDPAALLGGPAAAGRAARELFQNFRPRPGHVFNLGHGVLPSTTPGAARTLIEEVQRLGVY